MGEKVMKEEKGTGLQWGRKVKRKVLTRKPVPEGERKCVSGVRSINHLQLL